MHRTDAHGQRRTRVQMRMVSLRKPSAEFLRQFLREQAGTDFNYAAVGATATTPPNGFVIDRTRIRLGTGEPVFEAAQVALRRWKQFQLGWVEAWSPETPIVAGKDVAVMGRSIGLWWLNACRIVYVVEESGPVKRYGFAYGTLPNHIERGEERFLIEWDQETDSVFYDILAFSRPNQFVIRLGYPVVRLRQKQFGRDSAAAMFRAVGGTSPLPEVQQAR